MYYEVKDRIDIDPRTKGHVASMNENVNDSHRVYMMMQSFSSSLVL